MKHATNKRKKRSIIWTIPKEDFKILVEKSNSIGEILKFFNLNNKGGNSNTIKRRILEEQIDISHIPLGKTSNKGRKFCKEKTPLEKICTKNSSFNRTHLKKRLLKENVLKNLCAECGQEPFWNNKKLTLQLEHKNGISNDNRIENLCLLCPNCHSQTKTFAGRKEKLNKGLPRINKRKAQRPNREQLLKLLWKYPTTQIAKDHGVSDKAVEKWAKSYGLKKPPRGYWTQNKFRN
jgi:hypothetical protein